MAEQREQLKWRAGKPPLYFQCPKCRVWLLEGNPPNCPHQEMWGQAVMFDVTVDGPVDNIGDVLRWCGYTELADRVTGRKNYQ